MSRFFIPALLFLLLAVSSYASRVANVYVDMLKGYAQGIEENGDTSRYYSGRVQYHFFAETNDSFRVDFLVTPAAGHTAQQVIEKSGDIGYVRQRNATDTLKTGYFRVKMTGSTAGDFMGTVVIFAEKSKMNAMADSLVGLMTPAQMQSLTYVSMTDPVYKFFGQDNMKLADGSTIVGWRCADGPHGIRYPIGPPNEYAIYGAGDTVTLFPTEVALGCTWDLELTNRIGKAVAKESRAMGVYCNLGPMCDLVVNPRWGRAFETMGEDPYHVAQMTASQIRGIQSEKVIATPKHFGPYVMETNRAGVVVYVQERAFRELFCEPFRTCIEEADARAIMTCYHRVRNNGYTTSDVALLNVGADFAANNRYNIETILRHDWGFKGIIMTDWDGSAFSDNKYSYETDYDMSMPQGKGGFIDAANNIASGTWSKEPLERRARNIMRGKLWAWDGKLPATDEELKTQARSIILSKEHLDLSLEAARKSITLVKNNPVDGALILPISKSATLKVAVVGPYSNLPRPGGGGSSAVTADKIITPIEGIQQLCAAHPSITVTNDYNGADVAIVCIGTNGESEDVDRPSMVLPNTPVNQNNLVATVMSKVKKTVVVYTGGSASTAGSWSEAPAIVVAFYPGRFQGQAIAEVLFGDVNPSGHLNVTFPKAVADLPEYEAVQSQFALASADSAHGYFRYEKMGLKPLFWFGHGLSYTTFTYDAIQMVGGSNISAGDRIDVRVTVTNSGAVAGEEVVQLYVKPPAGPIARRVKDLRGFARIALAPKETKTATFVLGPRDFSVYAADYAKKTGAWTVIPGTYQILAGSTSDPEALTGTGGLSVVGSVTVN